MILISIFATFILSCNNSSEEKENNNDTISKNISEQVVKQENVVETDTVNENKIVDNYKYLPKVFHKEDSLYSEFERYLNLINGEVSSEKQIKDIFNLRKHLMEYVSLKVDKLCNQDGELAREAHEEFVSIGFLPVYVEGMYGALEQSQILNDEVEKYASEPFKLKIKFDNEYAKSIGGEYPYASLNEYLNAFEPAYELFSKYKETEYYKEIEDKFKNMLIEFVDIHKVNGGGDQNECFEGELHSSFYPWVTICNMPELFQKRFPNTVFTPIFKKLQENISEVSPKQENYLIVTDKIEGNDYDNATAKVFSYLEKGIDIVHYVKLKDKEDNDFFYIIYRFYSDKNRANEELTKILEVVSTAKIVTVQFDDKEQLHELY